MPRLFFEDFRPGAVEIYPGPTVTRDEIVAFAREFDPQPFHLDDEAAKQSFSGGLIASGWHTCAIAMRMVADGFLLEAASMGAPGIDEVKWLKPVRPGDTLSLRRTVLEKRESRSRPGLGLVYFLLEVLNQAGEVVMTQTNWIMLGRRDSAAPNGQKAANRRDTGAGLTPAEDSERGVPFLDDLAPGDTRHIGSYTFTPAAIVSFAERFDPQPFHLDAEAARQGPFGALTASGWHTAAIWMKLLVGNLTRASGVSLARGERPARLGTSPGFRDLKWLKPVYAGDTITYRTTAVDKRLPGSQPGWGLLYHHNVGVNQHGEEVFSFRGAVFWERRSA